MRDDIKKDLCLHEEFLNHCHGTISANYFLSGLDHWVYPYRDVEMKCILDLWKKDKSDTDFYIHIPFCIQKCDFCCLSSYRLKSQSEINLYVKDLIRYYRFFKPIFKNRNFTNLYIGGGTPSVLNVSQMKNLLSELFSCFNFDNDGQKVMEFNPSTSSYTKLKLLKDFGFNKVSFGVQSFNQKTLEINNRGYQTPKMVKNAVSDAKKLGFEIINIDLLFGLHGDGEDDVLDSMKKSLALDPDVIHLHSLQPNNHYLNEICGLNKDIFFKQKKDLIESVINDLLLLIRKNGYDPPPNFLDINDNLSDPHAFVFAKPGTFRKKEYSFGDMNKNVSIFGLGYESISHINGRMRYQMDRKLTAKPSEYIFSGSEFNDKREMISFIMRNLSYQKHISLSHFRESFGKNLLDEFSSSIDKLKEIKAVSIDDEKLTFLTSDLKERVLYALFFFERRNIITVLKEKKSEENISASK